MISQLEKQVTLIFLKTKKKDGFINIISIFSFIGIRLGVSVLIIVMSVMNGFRTELINKIIGFNAHVTIQPYSTPIDKTKIKNEVVQLLSKDLIYTNSGEGVLFNKDNTKGLVLRGYSTSDFSKLSVIKNENFEGNPDELNMSKDKYVQYFISGKKV